MTSILEEIDRRNRSKKSAKSRWVEKSIGEIGEVAMGGEIDQRNRRSRDGWRNRSEKSAKSRWVEKSIREIGEVARNREELQPSIRTATEHANWKERDELECNRACELERTRRTGMTHEIGEHVNWNRSARARGLESTWRTRISQTEETKIARSQNGTRTGIGNANTIPNPKSLSLSLFQEGGEQLVAERVAESIRRPCCGDRTNASRRPCCEITVLRRTVAEPDEWTNVKTIAEFRRGRTQSESLLQNRRSDEQNVLPTPVAE
ncbi:hypothetical protein ZOSMA_264G00160 [Zostera marina]|uniref:Uncharacterized protein n=1 Tax=Zostera marina TaxID=29655 RepID=A0A0K9PEP0_ZOSMR|nr:hypothetical protein ZOSMA_264G00160 [Zostera marina]